MSMEDLAKSISGYSCLLLGEDIRIPQVMFDLTETYRELIGLTVTSGSEKVKGKPIVDARQRIRFLFDKEGAELESEAVVVLFGDMGVRNFPFTSPFLVLLMRREAQSPYFVLWVGNSELLVPADGPVIDED